MNNEVIANRLLAMRGKKTRKEVAEAIGISRSALSMYENGKRIPRDNIKIAIAQYYKKNVESIFFK